MLCARKEVDSREREVQTFTNKFSLWMCQLSQKCFNNATNTNRNSHCLQKFNIFSHFVCYFIAFCGGAIGLESCATKEIVNWKLKSNRNYVNKSTNHAHWHSKSHGQSYETIGIKHIYKFIDSSECSGELRELARVRMHLRKASKSRRKNLKKSETRETFFFFFFNVSQLDEVKVSLH